MRNTPQRHSAFTLVELLVVIAIIAMLSMVMLPAVQATRRAARQAQCKSNLFQVILAAQNYDMAQEHFPSGVLDPTPGPIRNVAEGMHQSWTISLLAYLDEGNVHRTLDLEKSVYDAANQAARAYHVSALNCPLGTVDIELPQTSYAACHHDLEAPIDEKNHGVFYLNSKTTHDDIRDGLSHTVFFGERKQDAEDDLGWLSGTAATMRNMGVPINENLWRVTLVAENTAPPSLQRPNDDQEQAEQADVEDEIGYGDEDLSGIYMEEPEVKYTEVIKTPKTPFSVGGFGSNHGGGAHFAFGDGRIQFMDAATEPNVLQQLGHRDDGQLLDPREYR